MDCAHLISALSNVTGLSSTNVHIIGHSLGAHAAGFTGKRLNTTLGRISGEFREDGAETLKDVLELYLDEPEDVGCILTYFFFSCQRMPQ